MFLAFAGIFQMERVEKRREEDVNMAVQKCVIVFIILCGFQSVSAPELNDSVVLGQTAHLPCTCSVNKTVVGIEFTRHELPKDQYVIFVRDGRSDETRQDPQYSNRVNWTQDGILIHNVTQRDEGTFECIVSYKDPESEDAVEVHCSVNLTVKGANTTSQDLEPSGPEGENKSKGWDIIKAGLIIAGLIKAVPIIAVLIVIIVLVVVVVFCCLKYKRKCCRNKEPHVKGDDDDDDDDDDDEGRKIFKT